jgi:hypothetical protein
MSPGDSFLLDRQGLPQEQVVNQNRPNRKMIASSRYKQLFAMEIGALQHLILAGDAPFVPRFSATPTVQDHPRYPFRQLRLYFKPSISYIA